MSIRITQFIGAKPTATIAIVSVLESMMELHEVGHRVVWKLNTLEQFWQKWDLLLKGQILEDELTVSLMPVDAKPCDEFGLKIGTTEVYVHITDEGSFTTNVYAKSMSPEMYQFITGSSIATLGDQAKLLQGRRN